METERRTVLQSICLAMLEMLLIPDLLGNSRRTCSMDKNQVVPSAWLSSPSQTVRASGKRASWPGPQLCLGGMGLGAERASAVILSLCWSRKMKNSVRLIFSPIRQQTEMEGGERETGGWVLHYRHQQGLVKRGLGYLEN